MSPLSPSEYGAHLASLAPPLTDAQVEGAARVLAGVGAEDEAA